MKYKLLEFRILILILTSFTCFNAQEGDTAKIYKKIKKFSERRTLTTWMYDAIFTEPSPEEYPDEPAALRFGELAANGSNLNLFGFNFIDKVNYPNLADLSWNASGAGANFKLVPSSSSIIINCTVAYSN